MKNAIKKLITLTFVASLLCSLVLTSCGTTEDANIIHWEISDEALALREKLMLTKPTDFDAESYYEQMKELYYSRTVQKIPETEVKNNLKKEDFMKYDLYTLDNGDDYENIVLYIHGGAWTYEIDTLHVTLCDELVDRLNAKVYMPLYPLAPEATYYESYRMVTELYRKLLEEGKPIYVMGDSAGGNISLGVMYLIKKFNYQMPAKMVLLAPCTDMSFTNEEIKEVEPNDPILNTELCKYCAEMWAYEKDLKDPLLSAVYADTSGYPDTLLISGTYDILYPDNVKLYEKMKKDGNNIQMVIGDGLWHVFSVSNLPEKTKTLDLIEEFCGK